ncbi:M3 family metallopeptidase [Blochmannia endosymbiont of Camponotus (Colobopsis) obliquus]|uniref:M3 family metallopeptidase n=1 Tax=Blochmannia endosymbiont of Camponotus (Colobopsis) obliquus TaxID=1505597 RepID=UPI00061A7C62|nr:M3 family metallopeptidase [Blochmannia endosymbiont of Camponotus (Colobopsis) obliquus]AKC60207.1 oligopeptidase A [Blochmannia endosymbiont of Camponotus (Colobopsis) obliquus]
MYELPLFSSICLEERKIDMKNVLTCCYNNIEHILLNKDTSFKWETLCQPLSFAENQLQRVWSPIAHLNAVQHSKTIRKIYAECLILLIEYRSWMSNHKGLYNAYCNLRNSDYYTKLSLSQKKVIDNALLDFELSGVTLPEQKQKCCKEIISRLSRLSMIYGNNMIDATAAWSKLIIDKNMLSGMPQRDIDTARIAAKINGQNGWLLTLHYPFYTSLMTYCDNTVLRQEMYLAYHTRASDQGPYAGKWDNGPVMNEIVILRYELARLLGFNNYIDRSLTTKMFKNADQVLHFLNTLFARVEKRGRQEWLQLESFVARFFDHKMLHPWDVAFYKEKQKNFLFSICDEKIRDYFPQHKVIKGMFEVMHRVYGINIKERYGVDVWHPDVQFFDIFNAYNDGYRGGFYLDLFVRDNKRQGAWMDECMGVFYEDNSNICQYPIAYLVCNFHPSFNGQEVLLTHNEVITLFHEFGHVLHHVLTRITVPEVAGINGVPCDAVEFPSQLMEYFCWEPNVLQFISGHYKTGEPLSKKLCSNLIAARNHQSASLILHQLIYSLFDFYIHRERPRTKSLQLMSILKHIQKKTSLFSTINYAYLPYTFSHIFVDNYEAGYYGYLWSNVLAADAWSFFKEVGIFNPIIGKSFLDNILAAGGAEDPMDMFVRFRGRKPKIDAMLLYNGIY